MASFFLLLSELKGTHTETHTLSLTSLSSLVRIPVKPSAPPQPPTKPFSLAWETPGSSTQPETSVHRGPTGYSLGWLALARCLLYASPALQNN